MHEEYALQQDIPIAKIPVPKKSFASKLLVILIITVTAAAIMLSCFTAIVNFVFQFAFFNEPLYLSLLLTIPLYTLGSWSLALVLPVMVLIAAKIRKPTFAKVLFFVSLIFLTVQLLAAFICLILSFYASYAVIDFVGFFCGSKSLCGFVLTINRLFELIENLIHGNSIITALVYAINNALTSFEELLFIVKNVLCAVLCLVLMKK